MARLYVDEDFPLPVTKHLRQLGWAEAQSLNRTKLAA